jgi:hypothetical protein
MLRSVFFTSRGLSRALDRRRPPSFPDIRYCRGRPNWFQNHARHIDIPREMTLLLCQLGAGFLPTCNRYRRISPALWTDRHPTIVKIQQHADLRGILTGQEMDAVVGKCGTRMPWPGDCHCRDGRCELEYAGYLALVVGMHVCGGIEEGVRLFNAPLKTTNFPVDPNKNGSCGARSRRRVSQYTRGFRALATLAHT